MSRRIREEFPGLRRGEWRETSPANPHYNCIAWAAGDNARWWGPGRDYWPEGIPEEFSLDAVIAAFETLGYGVTEEELAYHEDIEKVAIFGGPEGTPTHVARQVGPERWTSKLGRERDIEHPLHAIEGENYGSVAVVMERALDNSPDE